MLTYGDLMLYALEFARCPSLYDTQDPRGYVPPSGRRWVQARTKSIPYYFNRMFVHVPMMDLEGRPTRKQLPRDAVESLLAQTFVRTDADWLAMGLRPPSRTLKLDLFDSSPRNKRLQLGPFRVRAFNELLDENRFPIFDELLAGPAQDRSQFLARSGVPSVSEFYGRFADVLTLSEFVFFNWMKSSLPNLESKVHSLRAAA